MRDGRLPIMQARANKMTFDPLLGTAYSEVRQSEEVFIELLNSFGIVNKWDVDILVSRYVYDRTIRQIAADQNFTDIKTAFRRLRDLRNQLKERGFKPRSGK